MLRASAILMVAVMSCGGDDGDSSDADGQPIPAEEGATLCETFANHADECGWGGNVNGFDWNCGDATVVWRADAFRSFVVCASELDCAGDGASCYTSALEAIEPLDVHVTYAARCEERASECTELTGSCSAETFQLYTSTIVEDLTACFDEECADISTCMSGVL